MLKLRLIALASASVLLLFGAAAFGQQNCHDITALGHQTLLVNLTTNVGDWYQDPDPIRGLLDLLPVTPTVQYIPGSSAYPNAVAGRYWDFQQKWDFGDGNTFTVDGYHASFPVPPGKAGLAHLNASGRIISGTGRFEGATGTLNESGPWLFWVTVDTNGVPWLTGKYFATYIARVCTR